MKNAAMTSEIVRSRAQFLNARPTGLGFPWFSGAGAPLTGSAGDITNKGSECSLIATLTL